MIIDAHVHIGGGPVEFDMPEAIVLESMDKYHIDVCLVSNADSGEYGHDLTLLPEEVQIDQKTSLKRIIDFAKENEGKIFAGFWCKPHHELVDGEIDKMIAENRKYLVFLKVHPYHSNLAFDDDKMIPYLDLAVKYNLPVVVHTGNSYNDSPERVCAMAKKYPQLKFIMAHMGLGTDNQLAIDLMAEADNLYADTAWVPVSTTVEVIKKYGSKRVMFGTDSPIDGVDTYYCNKEGEPSLYRQYFGELKDMISEEDYENLMWRTAKDVFNI